MEPTPQDASRASQETAARPGDEERVLRLLAELLAELHGQGSVPRLSLRSRLDRDLGLDSVSRIELLERLERAFSLRFSEESVLSANTIADLLAMLRAGQAPAIESPLRSLTLETQAEDQASVEFETLVQALAWHARMHPERIHAQFVGSDQDTEVLRYGELYAQASRLAAGLLSRGIQAGDRVALMLPTGADYLRCFCAALLVGAVPVPLYPPSRPALLEQHMARQKRILENAGATIMVSVREALPLARAMERVLPCLRHVTTAAELALAEPLGSVAEQPEALALVQYTSGSTGDPKGVMLSHRNLVANIRAMGRAVEVTSRDVMVSWLPLYHDMGLIGSWLSPLYLGFPVVLMSPLYFLGAPARWLSVIHKVRGTISCAPNFAYELCLRRVVDADLEGVDLNSWRFALNGSEHVSARTVEACCERFARYGFRRGAMAPAYGLAECSVALTFPPLMRGPRVDRVLREPLARKGSAIPAARDAREPLVTQLVACGRPLAGHEVRVVDPHGDECADRQVGEIEFRGPSATRGYFARPEETRRLFHGQWLRTGDLGYVAEGDLYVTGRSKDMIIRAGQHIFPEELEDGVGDLRGVRKGCVAAFASVDAQAGTERLVVVAETREATPEARALLSSRIRALGADLLGAPPEEVVLVPPHSVPKTSSGKLRRSACRLAYERGELGKAQRHPLIQVVRIRSRGWVARVRRAVRTASDWAYAAYAWLMFAIIAAPAWLLVLLLPRLSWRLSFTRAAARVLGRVTFIRFRVEGLEHLPASHYVIAVNHQSNVDPFVLFAALPPKLSIVAKAELSRRFWTRIPLDRLGVQYVERSVAAQSLADARRIAERARSGQVLLFFPEGTHSRIPGLLPFHMGAFVTAAQASLPIVPVVLRGTRSVLRSDTYLPRRGAIRITIGEPIAPQGTSFEAAGALKHAVRSFMLETTGEPDLDSRLV